ncbi:MAG: HNH endonuclease signature motif containing protein [Pseudomonadota bacterium]
MGQHANLYKRAVWHKQLRPAQLAKQPLCVYCQRKGITTQATVVDHIVPHRGDVALFTDPNNLQSLCKPCHDGEKQATEARGYSKACGVDGWPLDKEHPMWKDDFK